MEKEKIAFPAPLILENLGTVGGTQAFRLVEDFVYISKRWGKLVCPAGFVTTGISSPRITWAICGPTGAAFKISVFHDYLFSKSCVYNLTRKESDDLMNEGMIALGVPWLERQAIHKALRLFSWMFWKKA